MTTNGLQAFRDPRSVALVGASADPLKWGQWFAPGLLRARDRRQVSLVNRRGGQIEGVTAIRSLGEAPGPVELVIICVPPHAVPDAIDEAIEAGATGLIVITSGIDIVLGEGTERQLTDKVVASGARMLGANCLGMYDSQSDLQVMWGDFVPGSLGIVSQSGQIGMEFATAAAASGLGVSRFVSLGNQADVSADDMLADLIDHDATEVVALYLESFGDGRALVDTIQRLRQAGKPTLLLTVGACSASQHAAQSHTGSMTSSMDVIDAACRAAGTIRLTTPLQVADTARMLATKRWPRGRRVAMVGDSGGQGAVGADLAFAAGLDVQPFPQQTQTDLAAMLPYTASVTNPVDLGGGGALDFANYGHIVQAAIQSGAVDLVVLTGYFGGYSLDYPHLADAEVAVAQQMVRAMVDFDVPVVVHSQRTGSPTIDALQQGGITTHATIDRAVSTAGWATAWSAQTVRPLAAQPAGTATGVDGYWQARQLLIEAGVRFAPATTVHAAADVDDAIAGMDAPFVLKAAWLAHKSDVGGVALNLRTPAAVREALTDMTDRLGAGQYVVEQMDCRDHVVEMLIGVRHDGAFGPSIVVGAGGTDAEIHADTTIELAPVDAATAAAMLRRLRCWPLLQGWRGRPATDVSSLIDAIVAVSHVAVTRPDLIELEVNPVRVGVDGAIAVDVMVQQR